MKYINENGVEFGSYREFMMDRIRRRLDRPTNEAPWIIMDYKKPAQPNPTTLYRIDVDYDQQVLCTYDELGRPLGVYPLSRFDYITTDMQRLLENRFHTNSDGTVYPKPIGEL